DDPDNEVDSLICNIPDINDENIIANIFEDTSRIYIVLESQDTIKIPQACLSQYAVDSTAWSVEVLFSDSTSRNYPFLGNDFLINPDSVILNPSGWAPLTAVIHLNLPVSRAVKINIA
ncbi:MAG: hypothetical protein ACP5E3_00580, partial [Bacteroidales bacterium]